MEDSERLFLQDMMREDDLGLVLRGQLHIEHQIIELCSIHMPHASRCDWGSISFRAKIEIAHGFGLSVGLRDIFIKIGTLRNTFAHELSANISKKEVLDLYNALPTALKRALKTSYRALGNGELQSPSRLPTRELLMLILLVCRQGAKAAVHIAARRA